MKAKYCGYGTHYADGLEHVVGSAGVYKMVIFLKLSGSNVLLNCAIYDNS